MNIATLSIIPYLMSSLSSLNLSKTKISSLGSDITLATS